MSAVSKLRSLGSNVWEWAEWLPVLLLLGFPVDSLERIFDTKFGNSSVYASAVAAVVLIIARLARGERFRPMGWLALLLLLNFFVALSMSSGDARTITHWLAVVATSFGGLILAQSALTQRLKELTWIATCLSAGNLAIAGVVPSEWAFESLNSSPPFGLDFLPHAKLDGLSGGSAVLSSLAVLVLLSPRSLNVPFRHRYVMVAIAGGGLLLANDMSAVVAMTAGLILVWYLHAFRIRHLKAHLWVAALPILGLAIAYASLQGAGRDSLTGRLPLWSAISGWAAPGISGAGPGSFWMRNSENLNLYPGSWQPGSSHNSYLTLLMDQGMIGLLLFVVLATITILVFSATRPESNSLGAGALLVLLVAASTGDVLLDTHYVNTLLVWLVFTADAVQRRSRVGAVRGDERI